MSIKNGKVPVLSVLNHNYLFRRGEVILAAFFVYGSVIASIALYGRGKKDKSRQNSTLLGEKKILKKVKLRQILIPCSILQWLLFFVFYYFNDESQKWFVISTVSNYFIIPIIAGMLVSNRRLSASLATGLLPALIVTILEPIVTIVFKYNISSYSKVVLPWKRYDAALFLSLLAGSFAVIFNWTFNRVKG